MLGRRFGMVWYGMVWYGMQCFIFYYISLWRYTLHCILFFCIVCSWFTAMHNQFDMGIHSPPRDLACKIWIQNYIHTYKLTYLLQLTKPSFGSQDSDKQAEKTNLLAEVSQNTIHILYFKHTILLCAIPYYTILYYTILYDKWPSMLLRRAMMILGSHRKKCWSRHGPC